MEASNLRKPLAKVPILSNNNIQREKAIIFSWQRLKIGSDLLCESVRIFQNSLDMLEVTFDSQTDKKRILDVASLLRIPAFIHHGIRMAGEIHHIHRKEKVIGQ
jgi:hypothetical protein